MKREIKFRAWIPDTGWLAEGFSIAMDGTEWYDDNGHSWSLSQLELMQYTGLKDKNGKEIYEGDIVKTNVNVCTNKKEIRECATKDLSIIPEYKKEYRFCQIDWYNGIKVSGWRLLGKDKRFQTQLKRSTIFNMKMEVVGNIYENPELLNREV